MKSKKIYSIACLLALTLASLTSCDDWLEATSSSQVSDKKLFSTRSGFHEALSGVYLAMATNKTYGAYYTWEINDVICVPYTTMSSKVMRSFQLGAFSTAEATPFVEDMWRGGYHIIACANKALEELERHRDVITDDREYNLIKGELLAARAYVHFDLMRMFGEDSWLGDNADKHTVPYVRKYTAEPEIQRSYKETSELLLEDISEALKCLENDPARVGASDEFNATVNADGYWTDRQKHLNYYAVEALQARVCLWTGDYVQAYNSAADVASGAQESALVKWLDAEKWSQESNADAKDWTFSVEHLFSLEVTNLYEDLRPYFYPSIAGGDGFVLPAEIVESIYLNMPEYGTLDLIEDVRGPAGLLNYRSSGYASNKFYSSNSYYYSLRARMPMIRLSEMYLIMAEALTMSFDYAGAGSCMNQIRSHRGLSSPSWQIAEDQGAMLGAILDEYFRETLGEGRYFFALRHLYRLSFTVSHVVSAHSLPVGLDVLKLKYPYPLEELSYGRVQDE